MKPTILLVEDDVSLRTQLSRGFFEQGFLVRSVGSLEQARTVIREECPEYALLDLRLPDGDGLDFLKELREKTTKTKVVVLTGWASLGTAMEAVRLGATHYLPKPATMKEVLGAFFREKDDSFLKGTPNALPTLEDAEWDHILRILDANGGNITKTAEVLGIHRRSLQRKLKRREIEKERE